MLVLTRRLDESIIGKRYGRLVVVSKMKAPIGQSQVLHWECRCDCGQTKLVRTNPLVRGFIQSCGCLHLERSTKHGMSRTAEYRVWQAIRQRCGNPHNAEYARYGGSGVTVCKEWENSFEAFRSDMGERPSPRHQIDRINNDLGYSPGNCRWATPRENTNNRRCTHHLTIDGVSRPLSIWAEMYGVSADTVHTRISRGWPAERALTQVVRTTKRHGGNNARA